MLQACTGAKLRLSFRLEVKDPLELNRLELLTLGATSLGDTQDEALVDMDELQQIHQDLGLGCSQLGGADRAGPLAEIDLDAMQPVAPLLRVVGKRVQMGSLHNKDLAGEQLRVGSPWSQWHCSRSAGNDVRAWSE